MKKKLGPLNALYPTPTTLVGAMVNGRPNFLAVAHVGIMNHGTPVFISISLGKGHYTNKGIKENHTFSVCLPSENLVAETDYCGIVTGKTTDKSGVFELFYGELETAPMIEACPVCMECRLGKTVDFVTHDVFVGEVVQTHADADVLNEGVIDIARVRPLLFDMASKKYWALGSEVATCWNIGKTIKRKLAKSD